MSEIMSCPRHGEKPNRKKLTDGFTIYELKCSHQPCLHIQADGLLPSVNAWNRDCEALSRFMIHEHEKLLIAVRTELDAIKTRHKEHDDGLRAMATEPKPTTDSVPLPCPFCDSRASAYRHGDGEWQVNCCLDICQASGPTGFDNEQEAIAAWNRAKR